MGLTGLNLNCTKNTMKNIFKFVTELALAFYMPLAVARKAQPWYRGQIADRLDWNPYKRGMDFLMWEGGKRKALRN